MNVFIKRIQFFAVGLIFVIAAQSTQLVNVFAQMESNTQDEEIVLSEGTALNLVVVQEVTSKTAKPGDSINFKVDEDLIVNNRVVVSKGTLAKGSVVNAEESGRMGKSGKLAIEVESTTTIDGQPLKLRAAKGKEGKDNTDKVVALSVLVSGFFMLKKGEEATFKEGTKIEVFVDEEKRFQVSGSSLITLNNPDADDANKNEEPVTVYIYRPKKIVGSGLDPSVFCDGVELGRMDNGRFIVLKLKPGKHLVHMTDKQKGYELNMAGGQAYYFRVGIEAGTWKGQGKITLDDNERGAAEVKKLKPLGKDKIKDQTMIVSQ